MRITKGLPRTVITLGFVSFFTDFSSEMIYPLLPIFLADVLGAGALALGTIEGIAEATSSFLKVFSGNLTDRFRKRKPWIVAGYGLAGMVRPLIGLATSWTIVLGLRFMDRVGKGLRTSPRDALIADVTAPENRGLAFGFHRAMDHFGAVVGPLVAACLLSFAGFSLRKVFLIASIPALLAVITAMVFVKEKERSPAADKPLGLRASWKVMNKDFKYFLLLLLIFTLGNSADAFLLLHLRDHGVPAAWIAVLWSIHHLVKMTATYFGGKWSDRFGRLTLIRLGWLWYVFIYLAFSLAQDQRHLIILFLAYGFYFGLTEPTERALIADLAPPHMRGTAYGYYHLVIGLAALPASFIFGLVWKFWNATSAFMLGAALAALAVVLSFRVRNPQT